MGYNLDQNHTAAIVWSDLPDSDSALLNRATEALAQLAHTDRTLSVVATVATRWVWIAVAAPPDLDRLEQAVDDMRGIRIAIGSTAAGIEGFRGGHFDAVATQRLLDRLHSPQRVAGFENVELVSLVTQDATGADQFIKRTLGKFESASPELQAAVRTFLNEQCNASRAATRTIHTGTRCYANSTVPTNSCRGRSPRTASTSLWPHRHRLLARRQPRIALADARIDEQLRQTVLLAQRADGPKFVGVGCPAGGAEYLRRPVAAPAGLTGVFAWGRSPQADRPRVCRQAPARRHRCSRTTARSRNPRRVRKKGWRFHRRRAGCSTPQWSATAAVIGMPSRSAHC